MSTSPSRSCWTARLIAACLALPLGCATSPDPAPGPGWRPAPAAWQHLCEQVWSLPQANALAAARGAEGWELVALDNGVMCFKSPVAPGSMQPRPMMGPPATMTPGPLPPAGPSAMPVVRDPGF